MSYPRQFSLNSTLGKLVFLFLCLLLIIFRYPDLLLHPRLWAEEGSVYYPFAYNHSFFEMLIQPLLGYIPLYNTIVSQIGIHIPLKYFPFLTTYSGLIWQLIVLGFILFNETPFTTHPIKKALLCLFLILSTPAALWLNSIGTHFHFGIISFLILFKSNKTNWIDKFLLGLGGLSSPISCFLTPAYLLKYIKDKSRNNLIDLIIISFCSIIQVCAIIYSILYPREHYQRFIGAKFPNLIYSYLNDAFGMLITDNNRALYITTLPILLITIILFLKNRNKFEYRLLMVCFIITSVCSFAGSLGMSGAPRYSYIPSFMIFCILINEILNTEHRIFSLMSGLAIAALLILSTFYFEFKFIYRRQHFPEWNKEVVKWEKDKSHVIQIHPNGWEMKLEK